MTTITDLKLIENKTAVEDGSTYPDLETATNQAVLYLPPLILETIQELLKLGILVVEDNVIKLNDKN